MRIYIAAWHLSVLDVTQKKRVIHVVHLLCHAFDTTIITLIVVNYFFMGADDDGQYLPSESLQLVAVDNGVCSVSSEADCFEIFVFHLSATRERHC